MAFPGYVDVRSLATAVAAVAAVAVAVAGQLASVHFPLSCLQKLYLPVASALPLALFVIDSVRQESLSRSNDLTGFISPLARDFGFDHVRASPSVALLSVSSRVLLKIA